MVVLIITFVNGSILFLSLYDTVLIIVKGFRIYISFVLRLVFTVDFLLKIRTGVSTTPVFVPSPSTNVFRF